MFFKRILIVALLWAFAVLPLSASMVSFLIIEEGVSQSAPAGDISFLWEGGLMGAFFDAGFIVSNSPVLRVNKISNGELPEEAMSEFQFAATGGAEYFVLAVMEHQNLNGRIRPVEVKIKIFSTNSQTLIFEQGFPTGRGSNSSEEFALAQQAARVVAAHLR